VIVRSGSTGEVGVATTNIANGASGFVMVGGEHELAGATGAIAVHAIVYRDTSGNITTTSSGATLAGVATAAKTTTGTTVTVLVNGRIAEDIDIAR